MKKIISVICAMLMFIGISTSHAKDSGPVTGPTCMVEIKGMDEDMFINTLYIRSISVDARLLTIKMASNYSAKSSYYVRVMSKEDGKELMKQIVQSINNCHKPR